MDPTKLTITGPNGAVYRLMKVEAGDALAQVRSLTPAAFADSLVKRVDEIGISWRALARESGVTNATLVDIRKKRKERIHPATMKLILDALERLSTVVI